jgi:hypothetical protein
VPKAATLEVKIADLPQVKAALAEAAETITALRDLLQAWAPQVNCPQCGQHYDAWACGPTHGIIKVLVWPETGAP